MHKKYNKYQKQKWGGFIYLCVVVTLFSIADTIDDYMRIQSDDGKSSVVTEVVVAVSDFMGVCFYGFTLCLLGHSIYSLRGLVNKYSNSSVNTKTAWLHVIMILCLCFTTTFYNGTIIYSHSLSVAKINTEFGDYRNAVLWGKFAKNVG